MRTELVKGRAEIQALQGRWNELALNDRRDGFFRTFQWYSAWMRHIRTDAEPFVIIVRDEAGEIAFELLGHRPYGYVSFVYELTPHLHTGQNVIAVKVDDSMQPASRWYSGAGINRQVRLVTTGDTHIVPWGTFVTTPDVSAESARIHIRTTVTNESAAPAHLSLRVRLTGPNQTWFAFSREGATGLMISKPRSS